MTIKRSLERFQTMFKRKPNVFLIRLTEQAAITVKALDTLLDYMNKPNEKNAQRIHQLEQDADEARRILIDELNRTFVTPIDRQDIFAMSRTIDDIIDCAD